MSKLKIEFQGSEFHLSYTPPPPPNHYVLADLRSDIIYIWTLISKKNAPTVAFLVAVPA
jgi:hypothetical protein